jgi:hypothetical protein
MKKPILILTTLASFGVATTAQAATSLGVFGDWEAYTERDNGKLVCFMGSEPTKMRGKYKTRGKTFMLITHRPAEKSTNVVSVQAGYTYKNDSETEVIIGKISTKLFVDNRHAFAYDAKADNGLVKAMIRGAAMTVKGTSSRGTLTTDTYSLKGFTAAYKAIGAACKV